MSVLTEAVTLAPHEPGVYLFLGPHDELLYVGKALDLRRRLGNHARDQSRTVDLRKHVLLDTLRSVHWETCADEAAALAREADLIVLLKPPFNASHTEQNPDHYLVVAGGLSGKTFVLTASETESGRVYGTFPHLAKGAYSRVAKRTKSGYTALLRLLWIHGAPDPDTPIPKRIAGSSPPRRFEVEVDPELLALLHEFLSGRSTRLLPELLAAVAAADIPEFTRFALERDAGDARQFFDLGPRHVRELRLRHAQPPGPMRADVMRELLTLELGETVTSVLRLER